MLNPIENRRGLAALGLVFGTAVAVVVVSTGVASAHQANVTSSCDSVTVSAGDYGQGLLTGTVFGASISVPFTSGYQHMYVNPDQSVSHTYSFTITAPDWPTWQATGVIQPCTPSSGPDRSTTTSSAPLVSTTTVRAGTTTTTIESSPPVPLGTAAPGGTTTTVLAATPPLPPAAPSTTIAVPVTAARVAVLPPVPAAPTELPATGGRDITGFVISGVLFVALGLALGLISRRRIRL